VAFREQKSETEVLKKALWAAYGRKKEKIYHRKIQGRVSHARRKTERKKHLKNPAQKKRRESS